MIVQDNPIFWEWVRLDIHVIQLVMPKKPLNYPLITKLGLGLNFLLEIHV